MNLEELAAFKNQHGRITYRDKFGEPGQWFGYIREVNGNYIIFQDNETSHKFKIHEVLKFEPVKLPEWRK